MLRGLAGRCGKVGWLQQGPPFQTMAFTVYCLGDVACPLQLQEACASLAGPNWAPGGGVYQGWV